MDGVVAVVARDGSADAVIRWASDEARLRELPLTLLHPWSEPVEISVSLAAGALPGLAVPAVCRAGTLADHSGAVGDRPDVLVVSAASRWARSNRGWAGRHCPLVLVPKADPPATERLVVGVCGTAASAAAVQWATAEASRRGAELVVFHAWQLRPRSFGELVKPGKAVVAHQHAEEDELQNWLREISDACGARVEASHGGPLDGLLEWSMYADLIVLGQHARSALARLSHGALRDDLARLATCPVAVVPIS